MEDDAAECSGEDAPQPSEDTNPAGPDGLLQLQVGQNLRDYRKALGLTQEQMAEKLCVHPKYVASIERGDRNFSLRTLERLAGKLGIHAYQLLPDISTDDA